MRVVSGSLGSRIFKAPAGHRTHPMSDKGRGALFNALGSLNGLIVLDAFSGSGALGFEAISRGATTVTAVDNSPAAQRAIAENIRDLGLSRQIRLIKASISAWLSTDEAEFDIVLADPPYDDVQPVMLIALAERTKLEGVFVVSLPPKVVLGLPSAFQLIRTKNYGDAQLAFYRRLS